MNCKCFGIEFFVMECIIFWVVFGECEEDDEIGIIFVWNIGYFEGCYNYIWNFVSFCRWNVWWFEFGFIGFNWIGWD